VDIVVTDFNMPGESGLQVAREVARLRPGLPVVLSSGFIDEATQQAAQASGVRALLRKEHTLEELPALLRRLLSAA
jgi:DNA-binding NarL/FixJ family response regulator